MILIDLLVPPIPRARELALAPLRIRADITRALLGEARAAHADTVETLVRIDTKKLALHMTLEGLNTTSRIRALALELRDDFDHFDQPGVRTALRAAESAREDWEFATALRDLTTAIARYEGYAAAVALRVAQFDAALATLATTSPWTEAIQPAALPPGTPPAR